MKTLKLLTKTEKKICWGLILGTGREDNNNIP
jgi:hypothetical protein